MASVDRRPNGKWRARWREYPGGPQKAKHFRRKVDAERFLVTVQHELHQGVYVAPDGGRVTFRAFAEVYLGRQPWRASTAEVAARYVHRAAVTLGDRPLGSIRRGDVQAYISGLQLAPGTVGLAFQHLNAVFEAAVMDRLIATNPARGVKLPEPTSGEVVPPTREQVEAIYAAAQEWFRPAVVLGAGLGLRQAEASGLTVDRVDWLRRTVRVDRQWMSRRQVAAFTPPKTSASVRSIPASGVVLEELSRHVGEREPGRYVLHEEGAPVGHHRFGRVWRAATVAAGVEGVRFHDLRHTFASALIAGGCSVKAVQKALGHASAATTLNMYAHLWPGDEDRIRKAVDELLRPPAEDPLRTEGAW